MTEDWKGATFDEGAFAQHMQAFSAELSLYRASLHQELQRINALAAEYGAQRESLRGDPGLASLEWQAFHSIDERHVEVLVRARCIEKRVASTLDRFAAGIGARLDLR